MKKIIDYFVVLSQNIDQFRLQVFKKECLIESFFSHEERYTYKE